MNSNNLLSSFFFEKLQCGHITKSEAVNSGVTGPVLRATGYNLDLRKLNPHYFYKDVSFEIPLGLNGKVYDRFLVLNEEIFQSIKILFQVIDNLPAGDFFSEFDPNILNEKKHIVGVGVESANGIIYQDMIISNSKIEKLKLASPGQNSLRLLKTLMNNTFYEDKEMIWNSLLIKMSEVER